MGREVTTVGAGTFGFPAPSEAPAPTYRRPSTRGVPATPLVPWGHWAQAVSAAAANGLDVGRHPPGGHAGGRTAATTPATAMIPQIT